MSTADRWIVAVLTLGLVGLLWFDTRPEWPKPLSDLEVAEAWLQCIDCQGSFLERLHNMPAKNRDTVTKFLTAALRFGVDSGRLTRLDRDLERTWRRDSIFRAGQGQPPIVNLTQFKNRFRRGFVLRWRNRAAIALAAVGSSTALAVLDSAPQFLGTTGEDSIVGFTVTWIRTDSGRVVQASAKPARAPIGKVKGRVVDNQGREIAGAHLFIEGTSLTSSTRNDGEYTLTRVPAGPRSIRARKVGYQQQRARVTVIGGRTTTQNFTLQP